MSSHSVETIIDPVFRRRMPSYNEKLAPNGLSKPPNVSSFLGKQALPYFSYEHGEKDGAVFPAPWTSSKSSVVDGRSPVSHLSGMDGLHNIVYRQDNSPEQSHSAQRHTPAKQGFTLYTKSPELSSPQSTASVILGKGQVRDERVSPDEPVYLAVPRPVYGHSPCCSELCCVMGQRYSVEQGSPPVSTRAYEHTWRTGEHLYSDSLSNEHKAPDPLLHHKAADALLQQRRLHMEAQAETQKSMFSPERTHTLPTVMDQTYSPTRLKQVFGSVSEQNECLQGSPRAFPGLYPSHTTYEPVIYHNRSPISKYGQAVQHPVFYYSPANVEVEKRTESKETDSMHTEDVPVVFKHAIQPPGDHYMMAPSLHGNISLPVSRIEALPNPSFLQGFDYSSYMVPRLNVNSSPIHPNLKHPHTLHSKYINTSASKHMHLPLAAVATVHKDRATQHTDHQTSPTMCPRKSAVASSSTQVHNRYGPPRTSVDVGPPGGRVLVGVPRGSVHMGPPSGGMRVGPPIVAPAHLGFDLRRSRHHSCHVRSYLKNSHISPSHMALSNTSNMQKILYCPPLAADNQNSILPTGSRKRSISVSSPIKIHDDDDDDVYVVETEYKRQKIEKGNAEKKDSDSSPPMPVINNVFSLAPYQAYLQMSRLCLGRLPHRPVHSEVNESTVQYFNEMEKQQPVVSQGTLPQSPSVKEIALKHTKHLDQCKKPTDVRTCSPPMKVTMKQEHSDEKSPVAKCIHVETSPPQVRIKQESLDEHPCTCAIASKKLDLPKAKSVEEQTEPAIIKSENVDPADEDSCSEMSVCPEQLNIIKREPEETDLPDCGAMLEIKKCELDDVDDSLYDRDSSGGKCAQRNSSSRSETSTPVRTPPTVLCAPPRPESKLNFMNIPPQCLKLSTYNIILPETNLPRTVQLTAKPLVPPPPVTQALVPRNELQMPVRKHFFELHQLLIKLISKSVAATSEDTLRAWLSKMELSNIASCKSQKVSSLFGVKGREVCLNEEMKSSLCLVLQRLTEYTSQERCPFPFVVRTGAIFLPMLVVKEVLFPTVQGALIDQVLQEHKVELRPATLSEEKTLIQLHKRACSSRLRRLMSLKHLPDVYADVVNLLYYTCVCKQLGLEMSVSLNAEPEESCEGPSSRRSPCISPPSSPCEDLEELQVTKSLLKRRSRIKSNLRSFFLDCSSDEEPQNTLQMEPVINQEQDSESQSSVMAENSWMCPLASEEFPKMSENSHTMHQSFVHSVAGPSQEKSKSCSGVILKLRRTFSRKRMSYQPVLDSDKLHLETGQSEAELRPERSSELEKGWKWTSVPISHSKRSSLLKIKYCPYLSACHSAEHRRRWVLRSSVQMARRAMKIYYPDLVGKRIQHLYEEVDKSEVWYRGEVLRIHKAHPNPLKTVFEVRYDSEPEWKYYLELLIDYKKGWLKIDE